jgi:hypothetical protein
MDRARLNSLDEQSADAAGHGPGIVGAAAPVAPKPPSRRNARRLAGPPLLVGMVLAVLLIGNAAARAQATFDDGRRAYDLGAYADAEKIWTSLANSGDARSQSSLGYLYREGKGVKRNGLRAAAWYYRAAVHGEPTAEAALCDMHIKGEVIAHNLKAALFWCELSIEGGETSGIALRDRVLNRMSTQERDEAWDMVAKWHAMQGPTQSAKPAAPAARSPAGDADAFRRSAPSTPAARPVTSTIK